MPKNLLVLALVSLPLLAACSVTKPSEKALSHLSSSYTPGQIGYCYGHGCTFKGEIHLDESQWGEIQAMFKDKDLDPEAERFALATAVGKLEDYAGKQNGTSGDRAGTFMDGVGNRQLDCIDEAVNASNFIGLLQRDGLLQHHELRRPVLRSWVSGNILHATAVIEQVDPQGREKGSKWSVDSSFFKNGEKATVAPLEQWQTGWVPEGGVN
ncbi:hypothetical protein O4H49_18850 [Kiloniella laminariae]|uniref:Lipoprotein n=1 Tax=Kiloniella laminariae TaxID=454162 RepID=A0ABT4LP24_9PROT|nr:hypothetical protein [Kiloniella laminariae]MCZ4282851.1 hypothetical protein [Kiloniella laminariae]